MIYSSEYNTLVIAGAWNNAIFTPDWVSKFLNVKPPVNVEFPLVMTGGSLRISNKDIRIFSHQNKLNLVVIHKTDEVFNEVEVIGRKVAEYLPHTPVTGFGINFVFETLHTEKTKSLCTFQDTDDFNKFGYTIKSSVIRRSFTTGDRDLNFSIKQTDTKQIFEFNYHFDIKNLAEFQERLVDNSIIEHKKESLELLSNMYGLKLDDDGK